MDPSSDRSNPRGRGPSRSTTQSNFLISGGFLLSGLIYLGIDIAERNWVSMSGTAIWVVSCISWIAALKR